MMIGSMFSVIVGYTIMKLLYLSYRRIFRKEARQLS